MKKLHLIIAAVLVMATGCATWERLDGGQFFDDLIRSVVGASTSVLVSKIAGLESTEAARDAAVAELHYAYVRGFYDPDEIRQRFIIESPIAQNALDEYARLLSKHKLRASKQTMIQVIQGVRDAVE
jgi:hypothetical protein